MSFKNIIYKISHWEAWDWRIKYVPIVPVWAWNCLRSGSFWFFTPSNPKLAFGGLEGETKMSIYKYLPPGSYPKSHLVAFNSSFDEVERIIAEQFNYPLVVKPDVGRMGLMFRILHNASEVKLYHQAMSFNYIIQDLIQYPIEVSVFYYRFPNAKSGTITGFVKKEFLEVTGNGTSALLDLMITCPRVRLRLDEMKAKHADKLTHVLAKGEVFYLSYALNLSRGGKLVSLEREKDKRLLNVFDEISNYTSTFYYGRYDIKCNSVEDLKQGKNFSIIEYNGCGAEPHHVYGNGYTLWQACKILASHWLVLQKISSFNNAQGFKYWDFKAGWTEMRRCRKYFSELRKVDAKFPVF